MLRLRKLARAPAVESARAVSRERGGRMRSWEIQRRKAEKRRREAARRERKRAARGSRSFALIEADVETGTDREKTAESVIVKNSDESVFEAEFEEIQPGMVLVVEGPSGLIQRAVVEDKQEGDEEGQGRTVRIRRV
jgi:hypothetical protein